MCVLNSNCFLDPDPKGGFTFKCGSKKLGVQWTLLPNSRYGPSSKIGFSNEVKDFLELHPPKFGGKMVSHWCHFIVTYFGLKNYTVVNSLCSNLLMTNRSAQFWSFLWFLDRRVNQCWLNIRIGTKPPLGFHIHKRSSRIFK